MSDSAKRSIVSWIPFEKGGRRRPPEGEVYRTVARFQNDPDWPTMAWTLVVRKVDTLKAGFIWIAEVSFLSDEAPRGLIQDGERFELFEGRRMVATGLVAHDHSFQDDVEAISDHMLV